jgi:hypothetical protein
MRSIGALRNVAQIYRSVVVALSVDVVYTSNRVPPVCKRKRNAMSGKRRSIKSHLEVTFGILMRGNCACRIKWRFELSPNLARFGAIREVQTQFV